MQRGRGHLSDRIAGPGLSKSSSLTLCRFLSRKTPSIMRRYTPVPALFSAGYRDDAKDGALCHNSRFLYRHSKIILCRARYDFLLDARWADKANDSRCESDGSDDSHEQEAAAHSGFEFHRQLCHHLLHVRGLLGRLPGHHSLHAGHAHTHGARLGECACGKLLPSGWPKNRRERKAF
jgi:hypothetical protein